MTPRTATWLGSRGQAEWMVWAGIASDLKVLEPNVMIRESLTGWYEIYRLEAKILNPDGFWELEFCRPRFQLGDQGYEVSGSYHNDWKWENQP